MFPCLLVYTELTCQGISGLSCIFFHSYFLLNHIPVLHIQGCEREVADAEKGSNDKLKSECIMRLSWALVHSKRPEDVQRGIAMLEGNAEEGILLLCSLYSVCWYMYLLSSIRPQRRVPFILSLIPRVCINAYMI